MSVISVHGLNDERRSNLQPPHSQSKPLRMTGSDLPCTSSDSASNRLRLDRTAATSKSKWVYSVDKDAISGRVLNLVGTKSAPGLRRHSPASANCWQEFVVQL